MDRFKGMFNREDEMEEPMRACERCGFEYPEISLMADGNSVFCNDCLQKKKKEAADAEFRRKQAIANARMKYYCYDCKFHFSRKKDFMINMCPNCGSENFVEEKKIL
ncbi:hypothetical protein KY362_02065 [Candidatus Woesearchaeota archaeon]|nr:hypothetical protein [Candidatus Woesearchaeota archaeon]